MSTETPRRTRPEQHPSQPSPACAADVRAAEPVAPVASSRPLTSAHDSLDTQELQAGQSVNVPLIEERLSVEKRFVETGQVVVHIEPRVEQQVLEVPLLEDSVEVERVSINRFVEAPTPVRHEGDVTVVPVFEEVLVVQKRLMLKEEIRLVRRRVATVERQTIDVRKEEAHVLRAGGPGTAVNDLKLDSARSGTGVAASPRSAEGGRP